MKTSLNMLPESFLRPRAIRLRLLQWCVIWGVAGAVVGNISEWKKHVPYEARLAQLQAREREYTPLKELQAEVAAMDAQIADLQSREALVLHLADQLPDLTLVGIVSRAARHGGGSVCVRQFSLVRKPMAETPARQGVSAGPKDRRVLTLQGVGVNNLSVARFVAALRDPEVFNGVELKSADIQESGGTQACSYVLECVF